MSKDKKPRGYWTKERCIEMANKCHNRIEFKKRYLSGYQASVRNNWLNEIFENIDNYIRKPNNYWTFENCRDLALSCNTKSEFRKKSDSAYNAALKNKWLDEICQHMIIIQKPNGYWSREKCFDTAKECNSRSEFSKKYRTAYKLALKLDILDEVCKHMIEGRKSNNYWNFENCKIEALKYNNKTEFIKNAFGAYDVALKNNWVNEICLHMKRPSSKRIIWTKDRCKNLAKECNSRSEFKKKYLVAYGACVKHGWLDDICSHMIEIKKPSGYWTIEKSLEVAKTCTTRTEFKEKYSRAHKILLDNGLLDDIYKNMTEILKPKGYWDKKHCEEVAKLCKTRTEFLKKFAVPYRISCKNKWLDEICSHMFLYKKEVSRIIYSYTFYIENTKYVYVGVTFRPNDRKNQHLNSKKSTVNKFIKKYLINEKDIHYKIEHNDIINENEAKELENFYLNKYKNEGCILLNKGKTGNLGGSVIIWTKENCNNVAKLFKNRKEFKNKYPSAYSSARKNNWLDEICNHMKYITHPRNFWTKENCINTIKECSSKKEFKKKYRGAYDSANDHGWLDEICEKYINNIN
jgi:hypothetical protein